MKLKTLKLENFRQHEDSYMEFSDGITIINGPNGSGKSTVLEAITWAIYGTEAARGTKDSIKFIRAKSRSKVRVELVFVLDRDVFTVIRGLDKAEVYLNDNPSPVAVSQQEVTRYLTERTGMTKNEFFNTYFTGQKELNFLKNQGPTERRKFISKILDYERIREAQEFARSDKNSIEKEIFGLQQGLADGEELKQQKADINSNLAQIRQTFMEKQKRFNEISDNLLEIEPEWKQIKEIKEKFDKLSAENKFLQDKSDYLEKNLQNLAGQIKKLEENHKKLKELSCIEQEYKVLEQKIREQENLQEKDALRQKYQYQLEGLEKEINEKQLYLEEIIASGKEKKAKIDNLPVINEEINNLNKQLQKIESDLASQKKEKEILIQQKQQEIQKIEKQLSLITEKGVDGVCPTCERPLKDEFDKVTGNFNSQIKSLKNEIAEIKVESEKISQEPLELQEIRGNKEKKEEQYRDFIRVQGDYEAERKRYKTVKGELDNKTEESKKIKGELEKIPKEFDISLLKDLREQMPPLRKKYEEFLALKAEMSGFERIKKEHEDVINTKSETETRRKLVEVELAGMNYSEEKYGDTEKKYYETRDIFYNSREELIRIESEEKSTVKELEYICQTEESNREKLELIGEKQEELNLLRELDRFYQQLWENLNNSARPEISELAGKFLSDLTDNRYSMLELNEKYEICLHDDGEIKQVISGGEEDIVNLCIRLAISQLIANKSGKSLSLLILDEIFGSLDENRRYNVVNLLRNLLNSFEQIILITHIDDIKYDIDNIINIEFEPENGSSRVTMSDSQPVSVNLQEISRPLHEVQN